MKFLTVAALWFAACAALAASPYAEQAPQRLAEYLRVDTVNPPGNESAGVAFLAAILDEAGIAYETAESAPGRGNLWARLEGGSQPALVLLHHIDVVPADPRYWDVDPLAGEIRDGYVWGRGALDMKGTAVVQLQAFLALHAAGQPLNRDVLFVATADEEAGGSYGAGWLVEQHPEVFTDVGYLLNEGGGGALFGDKALYTVEVTQKVPLWLRVTARGNPGHGSTPQTATAVTRLLRAGDRIAGTQFPARVIEPVQQMFEGMAPFLDPALKSAFADIGASIGDPDFLPRLQTLNPYAHALLRNTCSITRLQGSDKINVVPTEAVMELDCRLLPDQDHAAFLAELETIINDPTVSVEQLMAFTPALTRTDTPLYRLIETLVEERRPAAVVVPGVSTGFTDSHFFRDLGISSYGFSPTLVPEQDRRGVHGNNERVSVEHLVDGTDFMIELLDRFVTGG